MKILRRAGSSIFLASTMLLAAHAAQPQAPAPSPFTGWYKNYAGCRKDYAAVDARVAAAGVGDAAYHRVPGFPYLRTDRLMASYRNEVHGLNDVSEWVRRMRELDEEARAFEYVNLGMSDFDAAVQRDRFLNCGRVLAAIELEDPETWKRMVAAVNPPDEYLASNPKRGSDPVAVAKLKAGELEFGREEPPGRTQPPTDTPADTHAVQLYSVKQAEDMRLIEHLGKDVQYNDLRIPNLFGSAWRALVELNAPQLLIENASTADAPAAPAYGPRGVVADEARPFVNYQIGYTRFGGRVLVQISYFFWFRSTDVKGVGPLDGFIWRVTLDPQFNALVYDSVHASGRDHRWYPVQALQLQPGSQAPADAEFVATELAPARLATLVLRAGTHDIRRVVPVNQAATPEAHSYELHLYEDLFTLPRPDGSTRSLFGPDGLVAGTQSAGQKAAGLPANILKSGALRQYSHLAIAQVGRRHFDDPYLLESMFLPPAGLIRPASDELVSATPVSAR